MQYTHNMAESTWDQINHGKFINQCLLDIKIDAVN